jgi:hypothetical protein
VDNEIKKVKSDPLYKHCLHHLNHYNTVVRYRLIKSRYIIIKNKMFFAQNWYRQIKIFPTYSHIVISDINIVKSVESVEK